MSHVLYNVLIQPLIYLLERVLTSTYDLTGSYGIAIMLMSVIINVLIAPFYSLADGWQKEEQLIQKKMKAKMNDIKAVFKGDEQFFYIRTLHRQHGYNSMMAVRSSFGLLIQIPFFIGAYQFLSHYTPFQGESFLLLQDLGKPDRLFGFINIMPIIMTALNLASVYVFVEDQPKKAQIQLYGMAALFLFLLYNSPSGLLLYWSCNNLIYLIKNLITKYNLLECMKIIPRAAYRLHIRIRLPRLILVIATLYICGTVAVYYLSKSAFTLLAIKTALAILTYLTISSVVFFFSQYKKGFLYHIFLLLLIGSLFQTVNILNIPRESIDEIMKYLIFNLFQITIVSLCLPLMEYFDRYLEKNVEFDNKQFNNGLILSLSIMVFLAGLAIPTSLVASAPSEMAILTELYFQVFLWAVFCLAMVPLFLMYATPKCYRRSFQILLICLAASAVINFLFFPGFYGVISESLQFEFGVKKEPRIHILTNLAILGLSSSLILWAYVKGKLIRINQFQGFVLTAIIAMTGFNLIMIASNDSKNDIVSLQNNEISRRIPLSKDHTNTVILFLDRALAGTVPEALDSYPELNRLYDGFTWYPDTLSFGVNTITTLPSMLGGYEYTPQGMAVKSDMTLKEKILEGVSVLPELFIKQGSSVYVSLPFHRGFNIKKEDLTTFNKDEVTYEDLTSLYSGRWLNDHGILDDYGKILYRDKSLFLFSVFRMAPKFFRRDLYDDGSWHSLNKDDPKFEQYNNLHNTMSFLTEWAILDYLPKLFNTEASQSTFSIIGNNATHEPYAVDKNNQVTNSKIIYPEEDISRFGSVYSTAHVYTGVAVLKKLTEWFNWMKEEGVYDNTQIIIVADHGLVDKEAKNRFFSEQSKSSPDYIAFNPLLMFKSFDKRGDLTISKDFMTNADVPSLILEAFGGRNNPVTDNPLNREAKNAPLLVGNGSNMIHKHHSNRYKYEKKYYVTNSMLDTSNWKEVKE